jgi:hypothetical protein
LGKGRDGEKLGGFGRFGKFCLKKGGGRGDVGGFGEKRGDLEEEGDNGSVK